MPFIVEPTRPTLNRWIPYGKVVLTVETQAILVVEPHSCTPLFPPPLQHKDLRRQDVFTNGYFSKNALEDEASTLEVHTVGILDAQTHEGLASYDWRYEFVTLHTI